MRNSMNNGQDVQSSTAQESNSSSYLVEQYQDTPFYTVETEDEQYMIVMANEIIETGFESREEAIRWIESKPWKLILIASAIFYENFKKEKQNETN